MIDLHSHILPSVDDGSASVGESLSLLRMLSEQGVDTVVATPHFYADSESVDEFLARRESAYERLAQASEEGLPHILLGAEVKYYAGIHHMEDLHRLCIGNSRLLLLEMSMTKWTEYTIKELIDIACSGRVTLVLAHIERFWRLQSKETWKRLLQSGILMQVNASFFADFRTARKAVRLLKDRYIHFVGSDCHDLKVRPPRMAEAADRITRKVGAGYLAYMTDCEAELLGIAHR